MRRGSLPSNVKVEELDESVNNVRLSASLMASMSRQSLSSVWSYLSSSLTTARCRSALLHCGYEEPKATRKAFARCRPYRQHTHLNILTTQNTPVVAHLTIVSSPQTILEPITTRHHTHSTDVHLSSAILPSGMPIFRYRR